MDNIIIAIEGEACASSPVMPYIGERINGTVFTELTKLCLEVALLRCGFDVLCTSKRSERQELIMQANRHTVDATIVLSCASFGSGKSFNDESGAVVRYSQGRFVQRSRVLCEDICAKLGLYRKASVQSDGMLGAANCPAAIVDGGYLTCFNDAKLLCDPDFAVDLAEHITMGACEFFGMPYICRDDITAYPLLCSAATGKRGQKIRMLQALLKANGYDVETDGIYGKNTDIAVKTLCINNGYDDRNGVTAAVWRDLLLLSFPDLTPCSKHNAVLYVQRKLYAKLYKVPRDGTLGESTVAAINEFARDCGEDGDSFAGGCVSGDILKKLTAVGGGRPRLF